MQAQNKLGTFLGQIFILSILQKELALLNRTRVSVGMRHLKILVSFSQANWLIADKMNFVYFKSIYIECFFLNDEMCIQLVLFEVTVH